MKCPKCGNTTYESIGGQPICPACGYGSSIYPLWSLQRFSETAEWKAYQESGHAVMAFLIVEKAIADKLFRANVHPNDRKSLLPEVNEISVDNINTPWGHSTFSLRSLTTVPIVLLAGYIAASRKYHVQNDEFQRKFSVVTGALNFCRAYVSEYGDDAVPNSEQVAWELFDMHWKFAEESVSTYWTLVEVLANRLLQEKTLAWEKVLEVIREHYPQ